MKKLFTLFAFLTCFLGASAVEIVDAEVDFSQYTDISQVKFASWGGSESAKARLSIADGCLHFASEEATDPSWDCQFFPIGGVDAEPGIVYTLHFKVKGDHNGNVSMLGFGQTPYGQFAITTDWVEGTVDYEATNNDGNILMQCGDWIGTWDIAYLKITHEGKEQRPVTWQEWLTDDGQPIIPGVDHENKWVGDAEFGQWPDWSLETDADGVNINWRGDRTGEICAWSIVRGKNIDPSQEPDPVKDPDGNVIPEGKPRPFPCDIEEVPAEGIQEGGHAFVVHTTAADNQYADWQSWDNQFFIQSPRSWKAGSQVRVKFKYKAEKPATANTQIHRQNPSHYLFYQGIGDVSFTTEWQEYDYTLTFSDSQNAGWSVAFNLNADNKEPNTFYFDDLSWETMVLDEGFFVAGSNTKTGIEYDYDSAVEFVQDPEDPEVVVATIGTKGKQETWVNEVMISTVRGNDKAFKGATIKPTGIIKGDDPDNWQDYTAGSQYKISLPAAGVWQISIAPNADDATTGQILFMQLEGDQPVVKEPVAIVTNETENVVNATERDWRGTDNDGNPIEAEVGEGQPWDNQFWIAANRDLETDEVTVIKFQYKATKAAKTSTQAHKVGDDGKPCTYLHYQAIGDVNFTEEWQDFETEFKVPAGDNGMRSIVFNMSEIKEANDYYIKNVQWYVKDATLEAEGKTMENLINETGADNFWIKVNKGDPEQATAINGVVVNKTAAPAAIYNIAGQRVSKSYKGIVVKDGKKYLVK